LFGLRAVPRSVQKTRFSALASVGRTRNKASIAGLVFSEQMHGLRSSIPLR
jgi:hypothetical protein